MSTITLSLPPDTESKLRRKADSAGLSLEAFLVREFERHAREELPLEPLPVEIHNRGRGPELKGTRITVYDVIPYRLGGRGTEEIAGILRPGYPAITSAHIEALFRYMDEHHDEVMAVHWKIEERNARGNPPEIEEKLKKSREKLAAKMEEFRRKRLASATTQPADDHALTATDVS